jgi:phosphoribosyl 1,2-cyclic phosphate phosphodiesterase
MQTLKHNICSLDGIIYTHPHFDHIGGFDDIRAFNFVMRKPIDLYLNDYTLERLSKTFYYAFEEPEQLGGGVPLFNTHMIEDAKFSIRGIEFTPIFMKHGIIPVIGYRIHSLAYCTDVNFIPDSELGKFNDLEYLIIGGLRYHTHPTHFTIDQAIEFANKVKAQNVIITHIAHQVKHSEAILPDNARLAFDDMVIEID